MADSFMTFSNVSTLGMIKPSNNETQHYIILQALKINIAVCIYQYAVHILLFMTLIQYFMNHYIFTKLTRLLLEVPIRH